MERLKRDLLGLVLGAAVAASVVASGLVGSEHAGASERPRISAWTVTCENRDAGIVISGSSNNSQGGPKVAIFDGSLILTDPQDERLEIEIEGAFVRSTQPSAFGQWVLRGPGPFNAVLRSPDPRVNELRLQCSFL
jgi:hypothetical protein